MAPTIRTTAAVVLAGSVALGNAAAIAQSGDIAEPVDYRLGSASTEDNAQFGIASRAGLNFSFTRQDETEQPDGDRWTTAVDAESQAPSGELPMPRLNSGLTYSAGFVLEKDSNTRNASDIVSSRQLGVHYGRLGSINYSGLDLGVGRLSELPQENFDDEKSLWSLGVTTGKRFAFSGLEAGDPIWTLSLRGQFNYDESLKDEILPDNQTWYFSPGLHWEKDSFRLSADVLMPFMQTGEFEDEDTNYSIRAKLIKKF